MKNIMVVVGSYCKGGNTDKLADAFIRGATEQGHSVTKVFLGEKKLEFCRGCMACAKTGKCVLKDDMAGIYAGFDQCDMIVLASPLHYWMFSASLKNFLDRLYGCAEGDGKERECALLMTAFADDFWTFEQAVSYYRFNCVKYLGWKDVGMVLAGNCGGVGEKRRIEETSHLEKAYAFGKSVS